MGRKSPKNSLLLNQIEAFLRAAEFGNLPGVRAMALEAWRWVWGAAAAGERWQRGVAKHIKEKGLFFFFFSGLLKQILEVGLFGSFLAIWVLRTGS